ncbi:MAG: hypothetical protein IPK68_20190 [Bdellovibrionales bacterium]|nr:hypothetical protein [Bdellovibrionales bacterium]
MKTVIKFFSFICLVLVCFQSHAHLKCYSYLSEDRFGFFELLDKNKWLLERVEADGILFKDIQVFVKFMELGVIQLEVALALVPQISSNESPIELLEAFRNVSSSKKEYLVDLLYKQLGRTVEDQAKNRFGQFGSLDVLLGHLPYYLPNLHAWKLALDRTKNRIQKSYGGVNYTFPYS